MLGEDGWRVVRPMIWVGCVPLFMICVGCVPLLTIWVGCVKKGEEQGMLSDASSSRSSSSISNLFAFAPCICRAFGSWFFVEGVPGTEKSSPLIFDDDGAILCIVVVCGGLAQDNASVFYDTRRIVCNSIGIGISIESQRKKAGADSLHYYQVGRLGSWEMEGVEWQITKH